MKKDPGKKTGKGGAREGSGRKAVSGMYTKTMRVPTVMEEEVLCLIDMYSNWLKHGKMEKGMKRRTTPEQRMRAIRSIQEILDYEKPRRVSLVCSRGVKDGKVTSGKEHK